jgi:hypothetical protein
VALSLTCRLSPPVLAYFRVKANATYE